MIPRLIHHIWLQGVDKIPEKYRANISSVWNSPGYSNRIWDEERIRVVIDMIGPDYLKKYDSLKLLHQKVDFARYAILYVYGGISVDMDATIVKSLDNTPHINDSDFIVSKNSTDQFINNATILIKHGHPLMKQLLDDINPECKWYQDDTSCIMTTTGPAAFTNFINKHRDQVTILDNVYFEPCSGMDPNCKIDDRTIIDHRHDGTWVNPLYRNSVNIYYTIKPYRLIIFVAIILIILYLILHNNS